MQQNGSQWMQVIVLVEILILGLLIFLNFSIQSPRNKERAFRFIAATFILTIVTSFVVSYFLSSQSKFVTSLNLILIFFKILVIFKLTSINPDFDESILMVTALFQSALLWGYNCSLSSSFLTPALLSLTFSSWIRKNISKTYLVILSSFFIFLFGYLANRSFLLFLHSGHRYEIFEFLPVAILYWIYLIFPSLLFSVTGNPVIDSTNEVSRCFYPLYGTLLSHCLFYLAKLRISYDLSFVGLFSILGHFIPVFYILSEYLTKALSGTANYYFYLSNMISLFIFICGLSFCDHLVSISLSIGFLAAGIFISINSIRIFVVNEISKYGIKEVTNRISINFKSEHIVRLLMLFTNLERGTILLLNSLTKDELKKIANQVNLSIKFELILELLIFLINAIFLLLALYKGWNSLFYLALGSMMQFILYYVSTNMINAEYIIILWHAIADFKSFLTNRHIDEEELNFFKGMYSLQHIKRPKSHPLTIAELLRLENLKFNALYNLINPLKESAKGVLTNITKSFFNQYKERVTFASGEKEITNLNDLTFEEIMSLQISRIYPYLLLEIPLNFYGDNLFRKSVVNAAILSYIFEGDDLPEGCNLFNLESVPDASIASRIVSNDRYTNGYSCPVVNYYALYDEQVRLELAKNRVATVFPFNIISLIRSDSILFNRPNNIYNETNFTNMLVLYKTKKENYKNYIAVDGYISGSRSVLNEYTNAVNSLAGRAINMQSAFDTLLNTGNVTLTLENRERRVNVMHLFGLLVLDADFEIDYTIQSTRRNFLIEIGNALCSSIGDINTDSLKFIKNESLYDNIDTCKAGFLFCKSVLELAIKYTGLVVQPVEVENSLNPGTKITVSCTDLGSIYQEGDIWNGLQLNSIALMLSGEPREALFQKLKTAYKYGRMYLYLLRSRVIDDRFNKIYGRYYIIHDTNRGEKGISINIDALMQDYTSVQLTMPIIALESEVKIAEFINQYVDLYVAKLVMDVTWYQVYSDTLGQEFSFIDCGLNVKDAINNPRIALNIGNFAKPMTLNNFPANMCMILEMAETIDNGRSSFIRAQYDNFEAKFNYWITQYFEQIFAPALVKKTIEVSEKLYKNLSARIDKLSRQIAQLASQYKHEYIINLWRFKCLEALGNVEYATRSDTTAENWQLKTHHFLDQYDKETVQTFNPALMHSLNLNENNFKYFVCQSSLWRAESLDISFYQQTENRLLSTVASRKICDTVCFKLGANEKIPSEPLQNRVCQNFMFDRNIDHNIWQVDDKNKRLYLCYKNNIKLHQLPYFDSNNLPMYNKTPNLGIFEYKDTGAKCRYANFEQDFTQSLSTACTHYVMENPKISENTKLFLENSCLLNKAAEIDIKSVGVPKAHLATAATLSKISDYFESSSDYFIAESTRLYDFEFFSENNSLYSRSEPKSLLNKNFTQHIFKHVANFMANNSSRYELANIPRFESCDAALGLGYAAITDPSLILGFYNPFKPYRYMPIELNKYYEGKRFQWLNLIEFINGKEAENVREEGQMLTDYWNNNIAPFLNDKITFYKQEGDLNNPSMVGNSTIAMLLLFQLGRLPFNGEVSIGKLDSTEKYMDQAFASALGFKFRYKINNPLVKFLSMNDRWLEPHFATRRVKDSAIDRVEYSDRVANLVYVLSRESGLSLNYMHTVLKDLRRFGRDMEFSFRRDSEYWEDYDPLFYMSYYKQNKGFDAYAYNFDMEEKRGEYQTTATFQRLRYQNYIENLRPTDQALRNNNIRMKRPDCMSVYLEPAEVLSFKQLHDACSKYYRKVSPEIVQEFEKNPLLFFDKDKSRVIFTDWSEDSRGIKLLRSKVCNFDATVDICRQDIDLNKIF